MKLHKLYVDAQNYSESFFTSSSKIFPPHVQQAAFECLKIFASYLLLKGFAVHFIAMSSIKKQNEVLFDLAWVPLLEEILFRGIIQTHLSAIQHYVNVKKKDLISNEEKIRQKIVRIFISAGIFALSHVLFNKNSLRYKTIAFVWTFIGGTISGLFLEKYQTLSIGICAHGFMNTLYVYGKSHSNHPRFVLTAMIISQLFFLIIGLK